MTSVENVAAANLRKLKEIMERTIPVLKVDGKEVARQTMERTIPVILPLDESFDIGADTLTGVNDADYQPPFPLTARLNKLTIKVNRPQLSAADIKKLEAAMQEKAKRD